ncbi:tetratricopeptide repeat protein [Acanthopleuribacter pedis]|uniref:Tetratricopeptide repeat protein n=1 Tax=Acanthopleuribacter pedis TaxID=442870 RepID=A0A8J7U0G2_9BACT|nr:tetratricopeptide repeat protein [Acanthopleuribacter pedis]MBO1317028.1 tetratricopeptide repeat protein [Acanthopleuribacter pedis]
MMDEPTSDALDQLNQQWEQRFDAFAEKLMQQTATQMSEALQRIETRLSAVTVQGDPLQTRPLDSGQMSPSDDSLQLNDYGVQLYYCNELGQALQVLEEAAKNAPSSAEIWNNLGVVYSALGHTEKSITAFEKAAQINPHLVDVLNNRGVLALLDSTPEAALELLEQAGDLNPQSLPILLNLAQAHRSLNQMDKAIELWKRIKAIDPSNDEATQFLRQYYQEN